MVTAVNQWKCVLLVHLNYFSICEGGATKDGDSKKGGRIAKVKANHTLNEDAVSAREEAAGLDLPMEVDCKEVASNSHISNSFAKAPMNIEHLTEVLKVLEDFVRKKLCRTVLSFAEFKKLLLLRQTGKDSWENQYKKGSQVKRLSSLPVFFSACQPGDLLCSGVPEALLEKAIVSAGATEIDMKVRDCKYF